MTGLQRHGFGSARQALTRLTQLQRPALTRAIQNTAVAGRQQAIDSVFERYGFLKRQYVEQHLSMQMNHSTLQATLRGRYRPSSIARFQVSRLSKQSRHGRTVPAGLRVAVLRGQARHWRSAFVFTGRHGNRLVAVREQGATWRKISNSAYGPSVAGGFGVLRPTLAPKLRHMLRENYLRMIR